MSICLDAAGSSLAEPGFGRGDALEMVGTELHEQSHLLTCDVSSGHFGSRPGYGEPFCPHTPRPADEDTCPSSPVERTYARDTPTFGPFNRPSDRVADRPSELSRNIVLGCRPEDLIFDPGAGFG